MLSAEPPEEWMTSELRLFCSLLRGSAPGLPAEIRREKKKGHGGRQACARASVPVSLAPPSLRPREEGGTGVWACQRPCCLSDPPEVSHMWGAIKTLEKLL